ncbi:short chain dehydrogenase/reductase- variant [Apiospora phragmitis]|uniref:Short chain dehydrogenase/reductase- variant n=1 Tax=Apiospora phragmitis TaxID=2905665 RepID=A0ABR1WUL4_9PEZI
MASSSSSSAIFKTGNTAVITGGASGIGLALAKKCAGYGMKVLVADWNTELLAKVPADVAATYQMDVSKGGGLGGLQGGRCRRTLMVVFLCKINLLALNAGTGAKHSFDSPEGFEKILNVNIFGVVHGITHLLPLIKSSSSKAETETEPSSAIVITGSKQGITNPPGNPAYNASKAAVKSLAEQLSYDLRADHPSVSVHLLVPGWTWTGLAGGQPGGGRDTAAAAGAADGKKKPDAPWWPEDVVEYLEKKMTEKQFWVICPDNEVTEGMDKKRMAWSGGDVINGRPPLSRWREEYKEQAAEFMK